MTIILLYSGSSSLDEDEVGDNNVIEESSTELADELVIRFDECLSCM